MAITKYSDNEIKVTEKGSTSVSIISKDALVAEVTAMQYAIDQQAKILADMQAAFDLKNDLLNQAIALGIKTNLEIEEEKQNV